MPNEIPPSAFYCASPVWRVRIHPEPVSIREGCEKFPRHRRREWVVDQAVRLCCCGSLSLAVSTTAISAAVVAAQYFSACAAAFPLSPLRNLVGVDLSHAAEVLPSNHRSRRGPAVRTRERADLGVRFWPELRQSGEHGDHVFPRRPPQHRNIGLGIGLGLGLFFFCSSLFFLLPSHRRGLFPHRARHGGRSGGSVVRRRRRRGVGVGGGRAGGRAATVVARCAVTRFGTGLTPNRVTAVAVVTAKAAQTAAPPSVLAAPPSLPFLPLAAVATRPACFRLASQEGLRSGIALASSSGCSSG
mmetsp:Transcript_58138/g.100095  ORF Transcript_58138/g.100095 Transcript_58138/m.100095 type:complete len:301 (-) Transcript_58138:83-985(-)